jgi:hypothetical protein
MEKLRKALEGSDPTPMERLLAERAVFCWFVGDTDVGWHPGLRTRLTGYFTRMRIFFR